MSSVIKCYNQIMKAGFTWDKKNHILSPIKFDDQGLVPAIIVDANDQEVLMLGWMNEESIQQTIDKGEVVFFSRSRGQLWHKGKTSGDYFKLVGIRLDCDGDALVISAETSKGIACHTGRKSCFFRHWNGEGWVLKT